MKTFGMKLREERKKRSMTQTDFAKKIGVSLRMVGEYESGKRRPHRNKMKEYAEILEVPYEYLSDDSFETVLSVFNGVKDDSPAEEKYSPLAEETEAESEYEISAQPVVPEISPRAQQEMAFIQAHAHALFAGADVPQEAKDKFFESLYDSYLTCRSKAIESGMDVERIEEGSSDESNS